MWRQTPEERQKQEQRSVMLLGQGVVTISVSFSVSAKWLKTLTAYSKKAKIAVRYFDTEKLGLKKTEMYISGFKAKIERDTSYKGLWSVSFTLKEY